MMRFRIRLREGGLELVCYLIQRSQDISHIFAEPAHPRRPSEGLGALIGLVLAPTSVMVPEESRDQLERIGFALLSVPASVDGEHAARAFLQSSAHAFLQPFRTSNRPKVTRSKDQDFFRTQRTGLSDEEKQAYLLPVSADRYEPS
jgi:hypothetical protein